MTYKLAISHKILLFEKSCIYELNCGIIYCLVRQKSYYTVSLSKLQTQHLKIHLLITIICIQKHSKKDSHIILYIIFRTNSFFTSRSHCTTNANSSRNILAKLNILIRQSLEFKAP